MSVLTLGRKTKDQLFKKALRAIQASEGKAALASASTEIQLVNPPPFDARIELVNRGGGKVRPSASAQRDPDTRTRT